MHRVFFFDSVCPEPYDGHTLETRPQGGTESTATRVAEALAARGHAVRVAQHNRTEAADINGVEYRPFNQLGGFEATHMVVLRNSLLLDQLAAKWPAPRKLVWYHDHPGKHDFFRRDVETLIRGRGTAVLISDWQVERWTDCLRHFGWADDAAPVVRLYNPIPDELRPDGTPVDPDKFTFFSIPDRGLRETLDFFARLREHPLFRHARLHVASPGYRKSEVELPAEGAVQMGSLTWKRVIEEMRGAFMVLDYNKDIPEAFGLVHAEADAVGTPWIGARHGANPEVASHPDELMDLDDADAVLARIVHWREHGRPAVQAREEFRMSAVVRAWEAVLDQREW